MDDDTHSQREEHDDRNSGNVSGTEVGEVLQETAQRLGIIRWFVAQQQVRAVDDHHPAQRCQKSRDLQLGNGKTVEQTYDQTDKDRGENRNDRR